MKCQITISKLILLIFILSSETTPVFAQETIPLRISIAPPSSNRLPFIVAAEEGIYERNGLDVDQFIPDTSAANMMRDGMQVNPEFVQPAGEIPPIDTGLGTNLLLLTTDVTYPQDAVFLATLESVTRGHIVAQPEIVSLDQLHGKRLGYTGGSRTHFVALLVADMMGWDPVFDISLMANARVDALLDRRVDAIIANENRLAESVAAGYKPLFDVSTWNVPIAATGVVAQRSWLQNNQEAARRFMKSLVEAIAVVKQDKEVVLRAMERWWGVTDRTNQEAIYAGAVDMPAKPYPSVEGIRKVMDIFDSNEMRKYQADDFYDDTFVRELDESGYIDSLY